jgi:FHS family Na+ dependent glucose MFS transporter 1
MNAANRVRRYYTAGPPALRWTMGYFLVFICLGMGIAVIGPTLPSLAEQTGTPLGQMGLVFLAGSIGYTAGTFASGLLYDRLRGHTVLGAAAIGAGLMLVFVPFAPTLWLLMLLLFTKSFAEGLMNSGGSALLLWTHGTKVGPYMNSLHFFFGLGAFIAPLILAQAIQLEIDYRWVFWLLALIDVLAGLRVLTLSGSPTHPVQSALADGSFARPNYRLITISALFLFFYVGAELAFGGWIYSYATLRGMVEPAAAAYLTSAFWLAFTIGRLVSIPIATRVKPRPIIAAALVGCLIFAALLLLVPGSTTALWAATFGLGLFLAPIYPTGFTLAGQLIYMSARSTSLVLLGDSFGAMLLPWLVGAILDVTGPQALTYLVFASLLADVMVFQLMQKRD